MKIKNKLFVIPLSLLMVPINIGFISTLTSCSKFVPSFDYKQSIDEDWYKDNTIDVHAQWQGFYYDDVIPPWEEAGGINYNGNNDYVQLIDAKKDETVVNNETVQSIDLKFRILQDAPIGIDNFNFSVLWQISGSNELRKTIVNVAVPTDGKIHFNEDFYASSTPTSDSPNFTSYTSKDSVNIIHNDGTYTTTNNTKNGDIKNNFYNDFCWYSYLLLQNLQILSIDDSLGMYSQIDPYSFDFNVQFIYDPSTQMFDYLWYHVEGSCNLYILNSYQGNGYISFDSYWGGKPIDSNGKELGVDLGDGPKLLGGFTIPCITSDDPNDARGLSHRHYPQNFDLKTGEAGNIIPYGGPKDYKDEWGDEYDNPNYYVKNFLQLVPSSTNCFQLYNCNISAKTLIGTFNFSSGWHCYFLSQPLIMGLEFRTGRTHILLAPEGYVDSFASQGMNIPSYTLSNVVYDGDDKTTPYKPRDDENVDKVNITQDSINIDTTVPTIYNFLEPGNVKALKSNGKFFADYEDTPNDTSNNDIYTYDDPHAKDGKSNNPGEWYGWDNNNTPEKKKNVHPYDFAAAIDHVDGTHVLPSEYFNGDKKDWKGMKGLLTDQINCIHDGWNNLQINNPTSNTIPWYQAIVQSDSACYTTNVTLSGDFLACYSNGYGKPTTQIDFNSNDQFKSFGFGLNYMLTCNSIHDGSDNVFLFNSDNLSKLNSQFNNNPPSMENTYE